jgi:sugar/nucleoside kinase (ribokinase family)
VLDKSKRNFVMENKEKALFVGLNTVDVQFFVQKYPQSNTKTKTDNNEISAGGPATNASIAASHLNCDSTLITPIGKHALSQFLIDDISNNKVDLIDPINNLKGAPVFASIITDESNGDRTIFSSMPENSSDRFIDDLSIDLSTFNIALFDGFYPEMSKLILKELKKFNVPKVLDGGSWKPGMEKILPYIDIAILSNDFIPPLCETKYDIINFLQSFNIKHIAITNGNKPILMYDNKFFCEIEVPQVKVADTLGAGDFFHGAFIAFFLSEGNFELALREAAWVASQTCKHKGTRSWLKELEPVKT